ncbi:germinal-center associated nuclear protein isoform X2 [Patella vulgata]|uniref:germinal-center associated nuclear protein isoform X2 n=1 Tax=Patella vulgata TaxID=6465 RepID=UPI00217F97F2|nr:germinal-center associated nuclear protein isoform X2 [Patella vulgata]
MNNQQLFGKSSPGTSNVFGSGASNTENRNLSFGNPMGFAFGTSSTQSNSGNVFGNPSMTSSAFGSTPFGTSGNPTLGQSSLFGNEQSSLGNSANTGAFGISTSSGGFEISKVSTGFGNSMTSGGFGISTSSGGFGNSMTSGGFGISTSSGGFEISKVSTEFGNSMTSGGFGTSTANSGRITSSTITSLLGGFESQTKTSFSGSGNSITSSSAFGTQSSNSLSGTGGGSVNSFGNSSATGQSPVFGGQSSTSGFGIPSQSIPVFGVPISAASSTASGPTVFGTGFGVATSSASNVTLSVSGNQPASGFGNQPASLFGNQPASGFGSQNSAVFGGQLRQTTTANILFGTTTKPIVSTSSNLVFGSQGNAFGQSKASGISGTSSLKSESGTAFPSSSGTVFGGVGNTAIKSEDNVFGKASGQPSSTGLFGKPTDVLTSEPQKLVKEKTLFGKEDKPVIKSESTADEKPTGLFGKPAVSTANFGIFGKKKEREGTSRALFQGKEEEDRKRDGRKRIIRRGRDQDEVQEKRGRNLFSRATAGVFGHSEKRSREDTKDKDDGHESQRRRVEERGLTTRKPKESPSKPPDSPDEPRVRRRTIDDVDSKVAIVVKGIPAKFNKVPILKQHFKKYGDVRRVYPNINKNMATIHFDSHESADNAKRQGRYMVHNQPPLQIIWSSNVPTPPKSSSSTSSTSISQSTKTSSSQAISKQDDVSPLRDRNQKSKWETSDVDDELASMAGTADVQGGDIRNLNRPKEDVKKKSDAYSQPVAKSGRVSPAPKGGKVSPTASPIKTTKGETASFTALFQAICRTVWEKKELLDLRDKLIRQAGSGDKKKSDLATAKAFTGTCPDMCPEKERYDRQETRRLSIYEMIPGTENVANQPPQIDHNRAVKEYSRSSADQTEPLQHELRPEQVLLSTMTYLLREIADRGEEERWADWYDFLWNRTRGIRKDITQQQLCNKNVVELIEKCVRFHIYCSHRLCEQDMMVFDSKINDENMTKCLQTLKEMYYDLEKNQLIFCENEAEFRAYMVLANLNQGDTLREVQELRDVVRQSPEIRWALKIYSALNSNNYVRFFRLVKQASFLNACIVHRYFTQVRRKGLLTLKKALGKHTKYPHLVKVFAFEDTDEADEFCAYYGLRSNNGFLAVDSGPFVDPEVAVPPKRSITLIESKRTIPVREVINGGELPELNLPPPSVSFDKYGKFVSKKEILSELNVQVPSTSSVSENIEIPVQPSTITTTTTTTPTTDYIYSNEAIKGVTREIFLEVINEYVLDIAKGPVLAQQYFHSIGTAVIQELSFNIQKDMIRELCEEVIQDEERVRKLAKEQRELDERMRKEKERKERLDRLAQEIMEEYMTDVCQQDSKNMAVAEYRDVQSKLKEKRIERCNESLMEEIVQDVVSDIIDEIAADVFEVNVVQRLEQFREAENIIKLKRCGLYFQVWKQRYVAQIKLKRAMLAFPCGPSAQGPKFQLQDLLPDRRNNDICDKTMFLDQKTKLALEPATDLEKMNLMLTARLSIAFQQQHLRQIKAWQPLDIPRLMQPELLKISHKADNNHLSKRLTWKLVMSLPDTTPSNASTNKHTKDFCDWLKTKFRRGAIPECNNDNYKGEILSLYNTSIDGNHGRQPLQFGFCVQCLSGTLEAEEIEELEDERVLLGTSGLIFVLPTDSSSDLEQDDIWLESQLRLARIMQAKPMYPSLPLVVVCSTREQEMLGEDKVIEKLNLSSYIEGNLISDMYLVFLPTSRDGQINIEDPNISDQLCFCVKWLGRNMPAPPSIQSKSLQEFLNDVLLEEYFTPVLQDLRSRKNKKLLHQSPEVLIELYNSVIDYLKEVIPSPGLKKFSWPVPEFSWFHHQNDQPPVHWNTDHHLEYLSSLVSSLYLPDFYYIDEQTDSWQQVCQDVCYFVTTVTEGKEGSETVDLVTRVKCLLKKVKDDFEDTCFLVEREENCQPTYVNMPWTDLLQACIDYKLKTIYRLDSLIYDKKSLNKTCRGKDNPDELHVFYTNETFTKYSPPFLWKTALLETAEGDNPTVDDTFHRAVERVREEEIKQLEIAKANTEKIEIVKPLSDEIIFSQSIISRIKNERKQATDFEKYLESVVNDDTPKTMADFDDINMMDDDISMMEDKSVTPYKSVTHYKSVSPYNTPYKSVTPYESLMDRSINEYYEDVVKNGTISERLAALQDKMESDKRANHLFEQKLEYLLNS